MRQKPNRAGTVVVRLPAEYAREVSAIAAVRGVSAADIVGAAWQEYRRAHGAELAETFRTLAAELADPAETERG